MKRFINLLLSGSLFLVLAGLFLSPLSSTVFAASLSQTSDITSSTCKHTWSVVISPNSGNGNNALTSVAAISATDVWATGDSQIMNTYTPYIQHWDGTTWSFVKDATPPGGGIGAFAVISSNDVWAVGGDNNYQTFTEHWNGSTWTAIPSPAPRHVSGLGSAVALATNNVWAVGSSYDKNNNSFTLIEHWNGSSWSIVPSPNIPSASNYLISVNALSATNIWAVGDAQTSQSVGQTLVEHWNGHKWQIIPTPSVAGQTNYMYGSVAVSSKEIWAIGAAVNSFFQSQAYFLHWDGTTWSIVPSPKATQVFLSSITAISAKSVWTVGSLDPGTGFVYTLIEHWNGTSWSIVSSPNAPGTNTDYLNGISRVPGTTTLWAVGSSASGPSGSQTLTEFYC